MKQKILELFLAVIIVITIMPVSGVNGEEISEVDIIFCNSGTVIDHVKNGIIEVLIDGNLTVSSNILVILSLYSDNRLENVSIGSKYFSEGVFSFDAGIFCSNDKQILKVILLGEHLNPLCNAFVLEPSDKNDNKILSFGIDLDGYSFDGYIDNIKNEIIVDIATQYNSNGTFVQKSSSPDDSDYAENIKSLTPRITVSDGAVITNGGGTRDFTTDQQFTVTSADGKNRTYTVRIVKSVHQRGFDFSNSRAYLIDPSTSSYGSDVSRHGCPGPIGQSGNGAWYQHGFSYAKDTNGQYLTDNGKYIMSADSCGYQEFYNDLSLSKKAIRINKINTNNSYNFYSSGGGAPDKLIEFTMSHLQFKIEELSAGGLEIYFGNNRFMLYAEPYSDGFYKLFYGSTRSKELAGILKRDSWYTVSSIVTEMDNNMARGQLFINNELAKSMDIVCDYICYLSAGHVTFNMPANALGSFCLGNWGLDFKCGTIQQEIYDAYEEHVKSYDPKVLDWIAGLYDKETGGFYYSGSARDSEKFYPDLESTAQAMKLISSIAVGANDIVADDVLYTESMQQNVISWVQNMQDPDDGYFYHPQWGKNINSSRQGRDDMWAKEILSRFGASPLYPTSTERLAKGFSEISLMKSGNPVSIQLMSVSFPDCLSSQDLFEIWLDSLPWDTNPWVAGHQITSVATTIKTAGYADFCAEYIYNKQNTETGLWGSTQLHRDDPEKTTGGAMKISSALNTFGYRYLYADKALQSIIPLLLEDTVPDNVTYLYNLWSTLSNIKSNMGKNLPNSWYDILYKNAPQMIEKTSKRNSVFEKADGGWSYERYGSPAMSQGVRVSLGLSNEGDVNSTGIAITGLTGAMRNVLELKNDVAYFDRSYFETLKYNLQNTLPVVYLRTVVEDFEDCAVGEIPSSTNFSSSYVGEGMAYAAVVSDNGNKVLKFVKDKTYLKNSSIQFRILRDVPSSEFVCSVDFKVSGVTSSPFMWISFGNTAFQMYFKKQTTGFDLVPRNQSSNTGNFSKIATLGFDDWHNLKIVYTPGTSETLGIDVYIDDIFVADTSSAYFNGGDSSALPNQFANSISFTYFMNGDGTLYVDDFNIECKE